MSWQDFVRQHGLRARAHDLAAIVGQPVAAIAALRNGGTCSIEGGRRRTGAIQPFATLFALYHGRAPGEGDWPRPRIIGGGYEWQPPEDAFLATLAGTGSVADLARALTKRLRQVTRDRTATRNANAVSARLQKLGLQATEVLGGIRLQEAGKEIGSYPAVYQAIDRADLAARRVGRQFVIAREDWDAWKARRVLPPEDMVKLATLKAPLGIASDKLSEYARLGYIPTATRTKLYGAAMPNSVHGTWYVSPQVAEQLVADRRAGRPMPWHGKPLAENLRITYRLWQQRRHPAGCATCREIWGKHGAPVAFADYETRYPPLAHGAKRHLTLVYTPGLRLAEVARKSGFSAGHVKRAVANGQLVTREEAGITYVTRTEATRWIARKCPAGDASKSWISFDTAIKQYGFTKAQLRVFIRDGALRTKVIDAGPSRGETFVARHQCATLRERIGFTVEQAARKLKITAPRFEELLAGVDWRPGALVPLVTVQAVGKRLHSRHGHSVEEAAEALGESQAWIRDRIADGTVRVARAAWDRRRTYLTDPMMERLREAQRSGVKPAPLDEGWLRLSAAASLAGVSTTTVIAWARDGDIERRAAPAGWHYGRAGLQERARRYWATARFKRPSLPAWLLDENARQLVEADAQPVARRD